MGQDFSLRVEVSVKPCTHGTSNYNIFAIDSKLDILDAGDDLQKKFQHGKIFSCHSLLSRPIFIRLSNGFHN